MSARRPAPCPDPCHGFPLEPIHTRRQWRDALLMLGAVLSRGEPTPAEWAYYDALEVLVRQYEHSHGPG